MMTDLILASSGRYDVSIAARAAQNWAEELGDDFVPEFPRLKTPAGGGTQWEDPFSNNPDSPDYIKELVGVIVGFRFVSRMWLTSFEDRTPDEDNRPDAYSLDGKTQIIPVETFAKIDRMNEERRAKGQSPLPHPERNYAACPYSQYGSVALLGKPGKGKVASEVLEMFVAVDGKPLPVIVPAPGASIKAAKEHLTRIVNNYGSKTAAETIITLRKKESGQGITYSELNYAIGEALEPALADSMKTYAQSLEGFIKGDAYARDEQPAQTQYVEAQVVPVEVEQVAAGVGATDDLDI